MAGEPVKFDGAQNSGRPLAAQIDVDKARVSLEDAKSKQEGAKLHVILRAFWELLRLWMELRRHPQERIAGSALLSQR